MNWLELYRVRQVAEETLTGTSRYDGRFGPLNAQGCVELKGFGDLQYNITDFPDVDTWPEMYIHIMRILYNRRYAEEAGDPGMKSDRLSKYRKMYQQGAAKVFAGLM